MPLPPGAALPGPLVIIPLAGQAPCTLADLLATLLVPAEGRARPCLLLAPGCEADLDRLPMDDPDGIACLTATHGSTLEPGAVLVLPVGRHFVVEGNRLELRPSLQSPPVPRLERLIASLGERTGSTVLVAGPDDPPLTPEALAAFREAGGRCLSPEALRAASLSGDARPPERLPLQELHLAHELRQPLQTLVLLQSLLKRQIEDPRQRAIIERMGETLAQLGALLSAPAPGGVRPLRLRSQDDEMPVAAAAPGEAPGDMLVHVIDDDASIRAAVRAVLEAEGSAVHDYGHCEEFLETYRGETEGCLLVDAYLPGMSGLDLLGEMGRRGHPLPTIVMTGSSDVRMAVRAMKMGATDFLEKPVTGPALIACVRAALARSRNADADHGHRERALQALRGLTKRQRQIMTMVLDGHPSKNIAADLGISQRTVENHRAAIMRRTGSRSLPQLARLILALPTLEIE